MTQKKKHPSRREFCLALASVLASTSVTYGSTVKRSDRLGKILPCRRLGKTGLDVTQYCPGGWHIELMKERDTERAIDYSIERGVRFFDTSVQYGEGRSEELYGKYLTPKYREEVIIMSKTLGKDGDTVSKHIDDSLSRMRTDYIDLYMMHAISSEEDVNLRLSNGVLDALRKAREKGKIRHIGFTGHRSFEAHNYLLSKKISDLEACLLPINVADPSYASFLLNTVPLLQEQDIGIMAMKTLGNGGLLGGSNGGLRGDPIGTNSSVVPDLLTVREAHTFALSSPISAIVSGSNTLTQLEYNIDTAMYFKSLDESERQALVLKCASLGRSGSMEPYKRWKA